MANNSHLKSLPNCSKGCEGCNNQRGILCLREFTASLQCDCCCCTWCALLNCNSVQFCPCTLSGKWDAHKQETMSQSRESLPPPCKPENLSWMSLTDLRVLDWEIAEANVSVLSPIGGGVMRYRRMRSTLVAQPVKKFEGFKYST